MSPYAYMQDSLGHTAVCGNCWITESNDIFNVHPMAVDEISTQSSRFLAALILNEYH